MNTNPNRGLNGHTALLVCTHLQQLSKPANDDPARQALLVELARRYEDGPTQREGERADFIELAAAAGVKQSAVLDYVVKRVNPALYVGTGQFEEIAAQARELEVELVATSAPLSPVQQRNWEVKLNLPVVSRYDIVFSIFDQNAHTAEGQLQVELARLKFELPRIVRSYEKLDPLAGGIGTIGPGEQLTERIKSRHRRRIFEIEQKLEKLCQQRALRRRKRLDSGTFMISIVGYTNVGKSTLLNRLTGSGVLVEDKYFATLDPTVRIMVLPDGGKMLLIDTVGFIDDLPKELVTSFRATLEEMDGSRLLIHLADASHPRVEAQLHSVTQIIKDIGLGEVPELLVFNKCDLASGEGLDALRDHYTDAVFISAATGQGIAEMLARLARLRQQLSQPVAVP